VTKPQTKDVMPIGKKEQMKNKWISFVTIARQKAILLISVLKYTDI